MPDVRRASHLTVRTSFILAFALALAGCARHRSQDTPRIGTPSTGPQPTRTAAVLPQASPTPREVFRIGGEVTEPTELARVPFRVPDNLRTRNADSLVIFELVVEADGSVTNVSLLRSVHRRSKACVAYLADQLSHWRYKPATYRGRPVASYLTITVLHCPCRK